MELKFDYKCEFEGTYENAAEVLLWLSENIENIPHSVVIVSKLLDEKCLFTTVSFETPEGAAAFKLRWMD